MSKITPQLKPQITRKEVLAILAEHKIDLVKEKIVLVAFRGYYANTFGKPEKNDRNYYDDALALVTTNGIFRTYNYNVDPSKYEKGIAVLVEGLYDIKKHMHRGQYNAMQVVQDTIIRDGSNKKQTGVHGINIHIGGENNTWSEGCQTLPKNQFKELRQVFYQALNYYKKATAKYLLINHNA